MPIFFLLIPLVSFIEQPWKAIHLDILRPIAAIFLFLTQMPIFFLSLIPLILQTFKNSIILSSIKRIKGDIDLPWLELDKANMSGTFLSVPDREEMQVVVNEQLIVELYSK